MGATITVNGKAGRPPTWMVTSPVDAAPGANPYFHLSGNDTKNNQSNINMMITLTMKSLNEVVVIGYGVSFEERLDRIYFLPSNLMT